MKLDRGAKKGVNMMWTRPKREIINEFHYSNNISFIIRGLMSLSLSVESREGRSIVYASKIA